MFDFDDLDGAAAPDQEVPEPPRGGEPGRSTTWSTSATANPTTLLSINSGVEQTLIVLFLNGRVDQFAADGQRREAQLATMDKQGMVGPVTPQGRHHRDADRPAADRESSTSCCRRRRAPKRGRGAVSTYPNTYPGVPDKDTPSTSSASGSTCARPPGPRPRQAVHRTPATTVEGRRRSAGSGQTTD